ncbi:unnamed protein product [Adineta steineri]|uniref:FLYWCH-type domain-containing protein n=1 Tax=Adineta steineri TaxID=433720 RepID=A0A814L7N6_9BILA|nr:unnamed protein product [Adineta steineri]CAF3838266.1 unnamed protein product [Adineta steineri]
MPPTTRAAALRSQINATTTGVVNKTISKPRPLVETLACSIIDQQQSISQTGHIRQVNSVVDRKEKQLEEDVDVLLESLFSDQDLMPSSTTTDKFIEQEINKPTSLHHSDSQTSPSPLEVLSELSSDSKSSSTNMKVIKEDDPVLLSASSNGNENDIYYDDSNDVISNPVVKGDITVGTSTRNGRMIFMNQYGYLHMSDTKTTVGWRCVKRSENCKAVIYTKKSSGEFDSWNGKYHCHLMDLSDTRKRKILTKIKDRVLDEFISIKRIIEEEYRKANLSIEEKKAMPLPVKIESGLQKLRRKALPVIPNDQKFVILDAYKETYAHEPFLVYDKRKTVYGGRLLIFASDEQLKVLFKSEVLFADGTFKVAPKLFEQLNLQKLGLMTIYDDDVELRALLRGFMALALLPVQYILDGFSILKQKVSVSQATRQLEPFVSYFEGEWLNTFTPSSWSVNTNSWRTNNFAEAQNKRFSSRVVQPHPNLWRFIQCLKQEETVISHRMVQTSLGFCSIKSNKSNKSTQTAARKTKQIVKLLQLLQSKTKSLADTIVSLAHLVGEPTCRGREGKKKKNNVSSSDISNSPPDSPSNQL